MPTDVFIFRIGHLGDTLVSLPAVHRIAELHPEARLWLITNAPAHSSMVTAWDVLKHTGLFRGALFYNARSPWRLLSLAARCRVSRNARLYYLSPPRTATQIRRDRVFFRWVCGFQDEVVAEQHIMHGARDARGQLLVLPRESDRLLRTVDPSGQPPLPPYLRPPAAAVRRVDELLTSLRGRPLIALGPGSKMPAKKWFLDRYLEICRRTIAAHPSVGIVVFGGPEDHEAGQIIVRELGDERALNLAGATDIIESAAAMSRCSMYVGNDTGTMHLAATMGLPCVAIFTSRDNRDTWSPQGDSHVILRRDLPCSGCMLETCERERMRCLSLITVDDVWAAIAPRLDSLTTDALPRALASSRG